MSVEKNIARNEHDKNNPEIELLENICIGLGMTMADFVEKGSTC